MLATINTVDFIYVCDVHLTDPGFASLVSETNDGVGATGGAKKMGLSPEEIAKVKEEWEERQKRKQEKEKEKEKEKAKDAKDGDKDGKSDKDTKSSTKKAVPSTSGSVTPASPPTPTHQRYTLHRDIFALRLADHRRRRQATQAKELAPRLPGVPNSAPPAS